MNNNGSLMMIAVGIFAFCFVVGSCSNNSSYTPSSSGDSSFEYRYAKERVKLEGYSDSDADKAARAIVKFNEAQRKR